MDTANFSRPRVACIYGPFDPEHCGGCARQSSRSAPTVIDARVAARIALRAAVLWLGVRLAVLAVAAGADAMGMAGAAATSVPLHAAATSVTLQGAMLMMAVVLTLVVADLHAMRERPFLDNVGIGLVHVLTISAVTAALLECGVAVATRVLA